jgi:hypothetical protein
MEYLLHAELDSIIEGLEVNLSEEGKACFE